MVSLKDIGSAASAIESAIGPIEDVLSLIVKLANGRKANVSEAELAAIVAREQAAGVAINRASHLAGLREALHDLIEDFSGAPYDDRVACVDAIMAEVARRMP